MDERKRTHDFKSKTNVTKRGISRCIKLFIGLDVFIVLTKGCPTVHVHTIIMYYRKRGEGRKQQKKKQTKKY